MRVDEQIVFSVHRIMVRCNHPDCLRQITVYVSGGVGGSLDEALAQAGWWGEGEWHLCQEHS